MNSLRLLTPKPAIFPAIIAFYSNLRQLGGQKSQFVSQGKKRATPEHWFLFPQRAVNNLSQCSQSISLRITNSNCGGFICDGFCSY
jgi:hypothetical protein